MAATITVAASYTTPGGTTARHLACGTLGLAKRYCRAAAARQQARPSAVPPRSRQRRQRWRRSTLIPAPPINHATAPVRQVQLATAAERHPLGRRHGVSWR